jgi:hypothetical protein
MVPKRGALTKRKFKFLQDKIPFLSTVSQKAFARKLTVDAHQQRKRVLKQEVKMAKVESSQAKMHQGGLSSGQDA